MLSGRRNIQQMHQRIELVMTITSGRLRQRLTLLKVLAGEIPV
ncbi:hypothetical protein [Chamaesiphon sp.]